MDDAMERFIWISLAGALGTGARYLVSIAIPRLLGAGFPYATLAVNLIGSFLLAAIMYLATAAAALSPAARLVLGTGFCGGFTTYSTFNYETMKLLQERAWALVAMNVAATGIGCLVSGYLGWAGARLLWGK